MNNVAIDAGQAHRFYASITQCGKNVRVDLSRKNHLRHFERRIVRKAATVDDCLLYSHPPRKITQLLSTTMHDADAYPDLMKQGQLFSQRAEVLVVFRRFARKFDDKG